MEGLIYERERKNVIQTPGVVRRYPDTAHAGPDATDFEKICSKEKPRFRGSVEQKTRLELATLTLAR